MIKGEKLAYSTSVNHCQTCIRDARMVDVPVKEAFMHVDLAPIGDKTCRLAGREHDSTYTIDGLRSRGAQWVRLGFAAIRSEVGIWLSKASHKEDRRSSRTPLHRHLSCERALRGRGRLQTVRLVASELATMMLISS